VFDLSREEFLELFFEDLELPNLVRTQLAKLTEFKSVRAGFSSAGNPANIDVVRSLKGAMARRMALAAPYTRRLRRSGRATATTAGRTAGGRHPRSRID
jgi:uncharacterized sporulation protein YeaH/YhbH (DUF444 family)